MRYRDPGWKLIRIRDKHPGLYCRELSKNLFCEKQFFVADPETGFRVLLTLDPGWKNPDPGWKNPDPG